MNSILPYQSCSFFVSELSRDENSDVVHNAKCIRDAILTHIELYSTLTFKYCH